MAKRQGQNPSSGEALQLSLFADEDDQPSAVFESALSGSNAFGCCAMFSACSKDSSCLRTDIGRSCLYNDNLRKGNNFLIDG
jgi:hypothetical protein